MIVDWRPPAGLHAVIGGVGAVAERLAGVLAAERANRPLIVCGANVAASPLVEAVRRSIAGPVTLWSGSARHTPRAAVAAGLAAAREADADCLVALGGSSASDCAKAIAVLLRTGAASPDDLPPVDLGRLALPPEPAAPPMPLVCIPTTLSAAEFQPLFGMRDVAAARKLPYAEQGLVRRTILLDGAIAAHTPDPVWAETGVKLLDDLLYRYCTAAADAAADAVLEQAIATLFADLPAAMGSEDPASRQRALHAMWLGNHPLPRATPLRYRTWLSMVARHAIGGATGIAHGLASCVALEKGLRWHEVDTGERQSRLAERLGAPTLADAVAGLIAALNLPSRLSAIDVPRSALDPIVANMRFEAPALADEAELRRLVESFW